MTITYMGYQLSEDIVAGRTYIARIPRSLSSSRFTSARDLISGLEHSALEDDRDRKYETWTVTPAEGDELRDLRFAGVKYFVEVDLDELAPVPSPTVSTTISDEDRKLAEETFGLIERSEHVQADQPAVTPEPDYEDYLAPCNKTCPHDGTCTLPEEHAGDHQAWGAGTRLCSWPQADQPAVLAETWPAGPCEHGASLTAYCAQCDDEAGDETSDLPAPVDVSLALAEHTAPALDAIENATAEDRLMYPAMKVVSLSLDQAESITEALIGATYEILVAYDPVDDAIKFKIDGGTWSPPFRSQS